MMSQWQSGAVRKTVCGLLLSVAGQAGNVRHSLHRCKPARHLRVVAADPCLPMIVVWILRRVPDAGPITIRTTHQIEVLLILLGAREGTSVLLCFSNQLPCPPLCAWRPWAACFPENRCNPLGCLIHLLLELEHIGVPDLPVR